MVDFAQSKGHAFTEEEYNQYVAETVEGELSEFELELVSGGGATAQCCKEVKWLWA